MAWKWKAFGKFWFKSYLDFHPLFFVLAQTCHSVEKPTSLDLPTEAEVFVYNIDKSHDQRRDLSIYNLLLMAARHSYEMANSGSTTWSSTTVER